MGFRVLGCRHSITHMSRKLVLFLLLLLSSIHAIGRTNPFNRSITIIILTATTTIAVIVAITHSLL